MATVDPVEDPVKSNRLSNGFGKIKGAPKNSAKARGQLSAHIGKGAIGVGNGLNYGLAGVNKGFSGVNKGISGVTKSFGRKSESAEKAQPEPEKPKAKGTPSAKPIGRRLNTDLATFDWESIGYYQDSVDKGGDGEAILARSEAVISYLSDSYYSDYYMNTVLVVGTCFFSWVVARLGGGILWLGLVFLCTASVYRAEFRRFVRDTKDDMLRLSISDRLENETETLEWCNNLLSKIWVNYMPLMGDMVKANVNPILAGVVPGGGIDSVELARFHLGSAAPKVTAIKSYTKISKTAYEMDWAFAFDPNNRENMTKAEIRKQIMPKVVLKAAIGKGIISKKVPVNVEDMGFVGRMKIRLTFTDRFPMIEFIRVQFLEPPKVDYALKPIGGDTFGIDIMKFLPGLKSLINEGINWGIKNYLIAPNYQELNLVEILNAVSTDINSVLVVTLKDLVLPGTGDYYVVLATENSAEDKEIRTDTKVDTKNPVWNKTFYVLNNSIDQKFLIKVYKKNRTFGKDRLVGVAEFDLTECYQKDKFDGLSVKIQSSGKKIGFANFDLQYYHELEAPTLPDNTKGLTPESEVGILKLVLNEAKALDVSSSLVGQLSPYAQIYINGILKHKTRVLKRSNEPSFGDIVELLISSKSETTVKVIVKDSVGFAEDTVLGEYEGNLEDIFTQISNSGNPLFKLAPKGVVKLTPSWRPLAMTEVASEVTHKEPLGTFRVHIRDAVDLKNLEFHGKVDPYVKVSLNGKVRYETIVHPETLSPIFEEIAYIPVTSENQLISLDVFDAEKTGSDRLLGSTSFKADKFIKKGPTGCFYSVDGNENITKAPLFMPKAKTSKGYLSFSVSFFPIVPVYTTKEIEELKVEDAKIQEELKKEEKEQAKLRELYKKRPNDYEWVEVETPLTKRDPLKQIIPLKELVQANSGALSINIIKGQLEHKKAFLSVLVDEVAYPGIVSGPASNGLVSTTFGTLFIRDLKNSQLLLRESSKDEVEEPDDVYAEKIFPTLDILQRAYNEPITLQITETSHVMLQVTYSPSKVTLPLTDSMLDTGKVTVNILDGENLLAADSNGKSDPYAVLKLNGVEVVKTEVQKKTLNPTWNESTSFPLPSLSRSKLLMEVFDWDLAGDDDELGEGLIDLSSVTPGSSPVDSVVPLFLKGQPAGHVNVRVAFEPQYIRPQVKKFGGGLPGIGVVTKAPVKLVGGVAKGAVGGVGLLAGGVGKGGSKLIGVLGGRKRRQSGHYAASSINHSDEQSTFGATSTIGPVCSIAGNSNDNGYADGNGTTVHSQLPRTATSTGASTTSTILGGKRAIGRITLRELHALNDTIPSLQLKVFLQNNDLGTKEVYRTRKARLSESMTYKIGEEATFKAIPEDTLIVEAVVHRRLGKDERVGEARVAVNSVVDNDDDVAVEVANIGNLVLNVRYSAP